MQSQYDMQDEPSAGFPGGIACRDVTQPDRIRCRHRSRCRTEA